MATCDVQSLVTASGCFGCLMGAEATMVELALLCQILKSGNPLATCDIPQLIEDAACFEQLSPTMMGAVRLQLLCEILQGGSLKACIIDAPFTGPTDPAPCPWSIAYYPGPFPGVWLWDPNTSQWDVLQNPA